VTSTVGANVTSYQATGLAASTTYYFRVRSTNSAGDSANTSAVSATTQATAPAAPSSLTGSAVSSSQINLTWADNSSNETGFKVDRATNSAFTSGLVTTTVGANVKSLQATGLSRNTTYYFRVRAYNAVGDSANSNTASVKTKSR
jgi:predicted phage tail protein